MATQQVFKRHTMQVKVEDILKAHGLLEAWQTGKVTSVKLSKPSYMPLVIEQVTTYGPSGSNPAVSVAHYFEQNGDLMRDPEAVFLVSADNTWHTSELTQDPVGVYRCKWFERNGQTYVYRNFDSQVEPLMRMWAANLKAQNWTDTNRVQVARAE